MDYFDNRFYPDRFEYLAPPPPSIVRDISGSMVGTITQRIQPFGGCGLGHQVGVGGIIRDVMGTPIGQMGSGNIIFPSPF